MSRERTTPDYRADWTHQQLTAESIQILRVFANPDSTIDEIQISRHWAKAHLKEWDLRFATAKRLQKGNRP